MGLLLELYANKFLTIICEFGHTKLWHRCYFDSFLLAQRGKGKEDANSRQIVKQQVQMVEG
jgi:hypothetical protein